MKACSWECWASSFKVIWLTCMWLVLFKYDILPSNTYTQWQSHVLISAEKQRVATWNDVCRKWIDSLPAVHGWTLNFWGEMGTPCNSEGIKNRHSNVLKLRTLQMFGEIVFLSALYQWTIYCQFHTFISNLWEDFNIFFAKHASRACFFVLEEVYGGTMLSTGWRLSLLPVVGIARRLTSMVQCHLGCWRPWKAWDFFGG